MKAMKKLASVGVAATLVVGLTACGGPTGKEQKLSRERDMIKEQLAAAEAVNDKARTEITVLQSKLRVLREKTAAEAIPAEPVAVAPDPAASARLAELEAQAAAHGEALSAAQGQVMSAEAATAAARQRVAELEAELAASVAVAAEASAPAPAPVAATPSDAALTEQAALHEQLLAVQADKAALEARLQEQDLRLQGQADAAGRVSALEQSLADARVRSTSLAEQVAAMQADAEQRMGTAAAVTAAPAPAPVAATPSNAALAEQAALHEQLLAVQADKAALETRLHDQDLRLQGQADAASRVATLEQSLADARVRSTSLAEQVAAMQADAEQRLDAAAAELAAVPAAVAAATEEAAAELAAARAQHQQQLHVQRAKANDLSHQLQGAMSQNKALRKQIESLYVERDGIADRGLQLEQELQRAQTEEQLLRERLAEVGEDADIIIAADAEKKANLSRELDYQALLEEGQALLEACNASLDGGARELFALEQRNISLVNAGQRQKQAASLRLQELTAEIRRLRALLERASSQAPSGPAPY